MCICEPSFWEEIDLDFVGYGYKGKTAIEKPTQNRGHTAGFGKKN